MKVSASSSGFEVHGDSRWYKLLTTYVPVAKKVQENGERIIVSLPDIPHVGRFCTFQAP